MKRTSKLNLFITKGFQYKIKNILKKKLKQDFNYKNVLFIESFFTSIEFIKDMALY